MTTPRLARDDWRELAREEWRAEKCTSLSANLKVTGLKMTASIKFECSLLSIVVSSALAEWPVAGLEVGDLLPGKSLVDHYRTLDELAAQFRAVGKALLHICYQSDIAREFYGSSRLVSDVQRENVNRNLLGIMRRARAVAGSLDGLLKPDSAVLAAFKSITRLYPYVAVVEDFLVVTLRAPEELPSDVTAAASSAERLGLIKAPEVFDNIHALRFLSDLGVMMISDFEQLVRDVDDYRLMLRSRFS